MNDVIPSLRSRINSAKNLPCDGQMLHFVQHDSPSNKLRQSTSRLSLVDSRMRLARPTFRLSGNQGIRGQGSRLSGNQEIGVHSTPYIFLRE